MTPIDAMIKWFGSQAEIAKQLGVTRSAVTQWVRSEAIPPQRAIQIEALTKGQLKAVELVANTF